MQNAKRQIDRAPTLRERERTRPLHNAPALHANSRIDANEFWRRLGL